MGDFARLQEWSHRILGQATGLLAQRADEQAVALVDVRSVTIADTAEVIRKERVFDPWISDVDGR
jgi:hypothetical protein